MIKSVYFRTNIGQTFFERKFDQIDDLDLRAETVRATAKALIWVFENVNLTTDEEVLFIARNEPELYVETIPHISETFTSLVGRYKIHVICNTWPQVGYHRVETIVELL